MSLPTVRRRRRPRIAVAGLLWLALGSPAHTAERTVDPAAIRDLVERQMRLSRLPAVSLAVVRPGHEAQVAAFGRDGSQVTPDTPFLLGSVTKTITALAVAQLVDAGKVQFDDPISEHLPGFALDSRDGGRTITLRHALTHTSGLKQWSGHDRRAQRDAHFGHIRPGRLPGVGFEYSSLNYIVLGQVVEAVSGVRYEEYLRIHVFEPLDMRNSFANLDDAREGGLIRSHRFLFGLAIPGRETAPPDALVPAGFVSSSARDLGNYLGMLLDEGRFRGRTVVSPGSLHAMFEPWDGGANGAGMAWGVGRRRIGHAGSTPTFSARVELYPQERYGIALLTNVNSGPFFPGLAAVMDGVSRLVQGESARPVRPDEILLKLALLILVLVGVFRTFARFRSWSRLGFPRRLRRSRRVALPLVREAVAAVVVLVAVPRWVGVPLLTIVEYFPDLGIAMVIGVVAGASGALMQAFVLAAEPPGSPGPRQPGNEDSRPATAPRAAADAGP